MCIDKVMSDNILIPVPYIISLDQEGGQLLYLLLRKKNSIILLPTKLHRQGLEIESKFLLCVHTGLHSSHFDLYLRPFLMHNKHKFGQNHSKIAIATCHVPHTEVEAKILDMLLTLIKYACFSLPLNRLGLHFSVEASLK